MSTESTETALARFRRSKRMSRYLSHSVLLEEGGISVFVRGALMLAFLALAGAVLWASTTQIKQVAVTFGQVVPSGAVNKIQHLEGGIVEEILVADGDLVDKGQVLLRLNPEAALAELRQAEARRGVLALRAERLRALARGGDPDFTPYRAEYPDLVRDQAAIHAIQTRLRESQRRILEVQIKERNAELAQLDTQRVTLQRSIDLLRQEVDLRRDLFEKGLNSKVLFLNIQRELNEGQGNLSRVVSEMGRAREAIAGAKLRLIELENRHREQALSEMGTVTAELAQVNESIRKLQDRVTRLDIRAPARGFVKGLVFNTVGGVIAPGQVVMEMVPVEDVLIAETRISTDDIGHVRPGQAVTVKVTAFDFIRYGGIEGTLTSISATTFADADGRPYYKGRVALRSDTLRAGADVQQIIPGMTVQADIRTGQRTLLEYLLKPVYVSLDQAFRER